MKTFNILSLYEVYCTREMTKANFDKTIKIFSKLINSTAYKTYAQKQTQSYSTIQVCTE